MSRLIVKNLPNQITVEKLRSLFNQKGEITDVQLKYTKEGKFRNFGFVGFKNEEQADEAKNYFNGTYIKTSRICVETCTSLGSTEKPKAWSKHTPESTAYKKKNNIVDEQPKTKSELKAISKEERRKLKQKENEAKIKEILKRHKNDPLFAEFLEVHASKADKALWSNDNLLDNNDKDTLNEESDDESNEETEELEENGEKEAEEEDKLANQRISDFEYMKSLMKKTNTDEKTSNDDEKNTEKPPKKKTPRNIVLFTVKLSGLSFSCKKKDIKEFFRPLVPFTIRIPRIKAKVARGFCYVGFRTEDERKKALFKNKSFLGGNRINVDKYDNDKNKINSDEGEGNMKHKNQEESLKNEESIAESGIIFVRNLPYIINEDEVQALFEKYGPVSDINLPVDKVTHQLKGYGVVTFMMPEHAVRAYGELDGSIFCGRMLHLLPGKQKDQENSDDENLTYKQKKEKKQKAEAGSAHNWNSLFLGANAVADVIADAYDTTKENLLDSNSKTSAAVKLALGETQLVVDTRKFLEENGICLDVFNQAPKKRSKRIILVKNLPAKTTRNELLKVFEPFGTIARLVMPPHGITAVIEFVEPFEAKQAFSKLAYSKFKHLPLYLEWAPENIFIKPAEGTVTEKSTNNSENKKVNNESAPNNEDDEDEDEPEPNTTLFVKGLSFDTNQDALKQHFERCGRVHSVTIAMKNDPRNPGQKLSMGYGFIQYYMKNAMEKALKELQMSNLDNKQIEIKRSERTGRDGDVKTARKETQARKQTGTKILVRNVPFQANRREIQEIFGAFGEIKALRLPKKMTPGENRHRGFCFIEYYNKSDAKKSFETLCQSTHLYGRRLVLEWAKSEDDDEMLNNLRKRTAEAFNQSTPGGKKSKKATAELEMGDAEDE